MDDYRNGELIRLKSSITDHQLTELTALIRAKHSDITMLAIYDVPLVRLTSLLDVIRSSRVLKYVYFTGYIFEAANLETIGQMVIECRIPTFGLA